MKSSQSRGQWGPWKDHYAEMGRKTVIRRLAKYLPLSIEFSTAAALDGQADAGEQDMPGVLDGDFVLMDAPEVRESVDQETGEITNADTD